MLLGKVVTTEDAGGERGGDTIAKLAVAAHPVDFAPLVARVHFYNPPPRVSIPGNFLFRDGHKYVVIARRLDNGSFRFDSVYGCGQTQKVGNERFRHLLSLAR